MSGESKEIEKQYKCGLCKKSFAIIEQLRRHEETHKEQRECKFKCELCENSYTNKASLKAHIEAAHEESKSLKCSYPDCSYIGKTDALLRKHISCKHLNVRNHVCLHCNAAFHDSSKLKRHVNGVHKDVVRNMLQEDEKRCKEMPWLKATEEWWQDKSNQRIYMMWLAKELGYKNMDDWYNVELKDFATRYGLSLYDMFNRSMVTLFREIFPERRWFAFLFRNQVKVWEDKKNVVDLADYIGKKLGFEKPEDYYKLSNDEIKNISNFGEYITSLNINDSPREYMLKIAFPEVELLPWRFTTPKYGLWDDKATIKWFFDWLGKEQKWSIMEDYYNITHDMVKLNGGFASLSRYNNCLFDALCDIYPDQIWYPWLMVHAYNNAWQDINVCKQYCKWLEDRLNIKEKEDWYYVGVKVIGKLKGGRMLAVYKSLKGFLRVVYPDYNWKDSNFEKAGFSKESILWLSEIESIIGTRVKHKLNGGEYTYKYSLDSRALSFDGYVKFDAREQVIQCINSCIKIMPYLTTHIHADSLEVIFEYHSNFWHGMYSEETNDPNSDFARHKINPINKKTYGEMYDKSCERDKIIKQKYNLVIVWNYQYF